MKKLIALLALLATLSSTSQAIAAPAAPFIIGGNRPVTVNLPANTSQPSPLVIMLHSASSSGAQQEKRLKLGPVAKRLGMIYIAPDGTIGADGRRVWNAAKACCQKSGTPVDDITYIDSLIDEIDLSYPVDRSRIYFIGQSNGAFMSLAYACTTGKAAGIVSLAGALDPDAGCPSTDPFAFLHIHGDADVTIRIDGGVLNGHTYTSAEQTLNRIAEINRCGGAQFSFASLSKKDFDPTIPGAETTVHKLSQCAFPVIYWRIARGAHSPKLPINYANQILTFLSQHSR